MDSDLLSGRDLIIRGDTGAILYSTVSPYRASILPVYGKFRSLVFRGMTWEQDSVPLYAISKEPNGADGVTILRHDERTVEALEFHDCTFINCHGAVFVHGSGYDVNGKLRRVQFENCQILNPYGWLSYTSNAADEYHSVLPVRRTDLIVKH